MKMLPVCKYLKIRKLEFDASVQFFYCVLTKKNRLFEYNWTNIRIYPGITIIIAVTAGWYLKIRKAFFLNQILFKGGGGGGIRCLVWKFAV